MFDLDTEEFLKLAAKNAAKAAEDYITRQLFDAAIQSMMAAKDLNPELTAMADNYIAGYMVQQAVHSKKSLYKVLGLEDVKASREEIKRRFKKMALALHPDKNGSVVAEAAFKSVSNAYEVISDEKKRLAYDYRMGFNSPPTTRQQQHPKRSRPEDFEECMKSQGWRRAEPKPSSTQPSYPFNATPPQPRSSSSSQTGTCRPRKTSRCSCRGLRFKKQYKLVVFRAA